MYKRHYQHRNNFRTSTKYIKLNESSVQKRTYQHRADFRPSTNYMKLKESNVQKTLPAQGQF